MTRWASTPERRERNKLYMRAKRAGSEEVREKNRQYSRAYIKAHRAERLEYGKRYRLRRDYGMTWEEFNALLVAQGGGNAQSAAS